MSFTLRDDSIVSTTRVPAIEWLHDIMTRQAIPHDAAQLRNLSDARLVSLGMLAAVAGISSWRHDTLSDRIVLHERSGTPTAETTISDLEVPVYVSIICVMAVTIVLQHLRTLSHTARESAAAVTAVTKDSLKT